MAFFKVLTEEEKAKLKAKFEEYMRRNVEACARGDHLFTFVNKWCTESRFCKYCGVEETSDNKGRSRAAPDGSESPDPDAAIPKA